MNPEYLARMSGAELDEYARVLGFSAKAAVDPAGKAALIERRRHDAATVRVLGMDLLVTKKALSDKRVTDLLAKRTDADTAEAVRLMLGDDQFCALMGAVTDEDGTVDNVALGLAVAKIVTSEELKNF